MNTRRCLAILPLALVLAGNLSAAEAGKLHQGSPELERMKALAGTWKGTADTGRGAKPMTVEYRVVSGGSVVEEKLFAGTPKEMVTMYHDKGGKLALTHYCMLANRPGMLLQAADDKSLRFDFDPSCGVEAGSETHMHALTITFENADTITQNWKLFAEGKAKDDHPFTLKRVKV